MNKKKIMRLKFLDSFEKQIFDGKVLENPVTGMQTIVSILIGVAATFIAMIISLFIDGVDTEKTVMQITVCAGGAIALVWYILHTQKVLFSNIKIGIKIGYGIFVLIFSALGFLLGLFLGAILMYLLMAAIIIWLFIKVILPIMMETFFGKSVSKSSKSGLRSSGFRECSNCQHNTSRSSLNGFCELRGGNVSASDSCGSWDPC